MLDELIFCAGKGYWEIQYACADYYEVQNWNLDCFYPIIVLVDSHCTEFRAVY
jgi:hypothetical protein